MRVLFLTPQLPFPPKSGAALRNAGIIKHVARERQVHILTLSESDSRTNVQLPGCVPIEVHTFPYATRTAATRLRDMVTKGQPDLALRLYSPAFVQAVQDTIDKRQLDIIQIEGLEIAFPFVSGDLRPSGPRVIYDAHNAEYLLQKRAFQVDVRTPSRWPAAIYSYVQWKKIASYERRLCQMADVVTVASEEDRAAILALAPDAKIITVPSGVDTDYYRPAGAAQSHRACPERSRRDDSDRRQSILFTGTMEYRPNIDAVRWFCQAVMPSVLEQAPEAHLWIVGRRPTDAVKRLAGPHVTVTGEVEEDMPYFHRAAVYVLPMRYGGGVRLKLLQAMACGLPVVSTRAGAEGVEVTDGEDIMLAEGPEEVAAKVVEVLRDPQLAAAIGERARQTVEEHYTWEKTLAGLEEVYEGLVVR